MNVPTGSHVLLLGPNGAGKTTLIRCVMGLIGFEGRVTVNGFDARRTPERVRELIGYVPQNHAYYENLKVYEHARLSSKLKKAPESQVRQKLEMVDRWKVNQRKVKELSHGMRQRLGIAIAMIGDPPLLLLDEPTSNIDLYGQIEFSRLLSSFLHQGKSVLTTTHLTGFGELATEVIVIDGGRIVAHGSPTELLKKITMSDIVYVRTNKENLEKLFDALRSLKTNDIRVEGEWVVFSLQISSKEGLLKLLAESGLPVVDIVIERSSIESEYLKLMEGRT